MSSELFILFSSAAPCIFTPLLNHLLPMKIEATVFCHFEGSLNLDVTQANVRGKHWSGTLPLSFHLPTPWVCLLWDYTWLIPTQILKKDPPPCPQLCQEVFLITVFLFSTFATCIPLSYQWENIKNMGHRHLGAWTTVPGCQIWMLVYVHFF